MCIEYCVKGIPTAVCPQCRRYICWDIPPSEGAFQAGGVTLQGDTLCVNCVSLPENEILMLGIPEEEQMEEEEFC